jgi:hypothetical protein
MTPRRPSPNARFAELLSRFPPEVGALAKRCLTRLRRALPGCLQLVYEYPGSVVVAFGASERGSEAVVAVAIAPRGVRLYLDKSLPDPKGLLEGSGGKVRSVPLAAASDLERGDVADLIRAAIERSGGTTQRSGSGGMIFKSDAKKRSPGRTRASAPRNPVFAMKFAKVYPLYVQKAERKGRTRAEVDRVLCWLTGYDGAGLRRQIERENDLETFFAEAPRLHPNSALITGVVCGVRVEDIADPLMRKLRWMDKLIDELAKGRPMEKILRQ